MSQIPWYERCRRWGQTNLTEVAPVEYDREFWKRHWEETGTQGVIVNAGGIVAFYPSRFEHHYRAKDLGDRDLFGEIVEDARAAGLAVLARMDSNRAIEPFYREHPDWFGRNRAGDPLRNRDRYMACVNGPYYKEFIPELLREIIERYQPDGFTDNSWTGVGKNYICHCESCIAKFRDEEERELPSEPDWDDPVYRAWVRWNYRCRLENWDLNNRVTKAAGGPDCLWLGMVHSEPIGGHVNFADLHAIGKRTPILMTDQQSRTAGGFEQNALAGKLLHEVSSWKTNIPESMSMYLRGPLGFRLAANPALEARHWMVEGFAGGISPWWHIVGAGDEDRRKFATSAPIMEWHRVNEEFLYDREPVASVGVLWSLENSDYHGRDDPKLRVLAPYRGWNKALMRARIPFLPIHAEDIRKQIGRLQALVLPDMTVLSDDQAAALGEFVKAGGGLLGSGRIGALDETGKARDESIIEELFGIHFTGARAGMDAATPEDWDVYPSNSYLRLNSSAARHPILGGFEETDILAFGGTLELVETPAAKSVATFIPGFQGYPPEFAWMHTPHTDHATIVTREVPGGGRTVYFAADIDRCYDLRYLPDHGDLLANAARWALDDRLPLQIETDGLIDAHLYAQGDRRILHLVNLTGCNLWPGYLERIPAIGPVSVFLVGVQARSIRARVQDRELTGTSTPEGTRFTLERLEAHEMIVVE